MTENKPNRARPFPRRGDPEMVYELLDLSKRIKAVSAKLEREKSLLLQRILRGETVWDRGAVLELFGSELPAFPVTVKVKEVLQ